MYSHFVRRVLSDTWQPHEDYFPTHGVGYELSAMSPVVNHKTRNLVNSVLREIKANGGTVFCGVLYNISGGLVPGTGAAKCLGDSALTSMDWLSQGVINVGKYTAPLKPAPASDSVDQEYGQTVLYTVIAFASLAVITLLLCTGRNIRQVPPFTLSHLLADL